MINSIEIQRIKRKLGFPIISNADISDEEIISLFEISEGVWDSKNKNIDSVVSKMVWIKSYTLALSKELLGNICRESDENGIKIDYEALLIESNNEKDKLLEIFN